MIELDNKTSLYVDITFLNLIALNLTDKEIELIITSSEEIQKINRLHRGINKPTDVLSFPYEAMPMGLLGSIVIAEPYITECAKEFGHDTSDELALLFIHGLLHLLGYDHESDNGAMREEEAKLIEKFHLPKSLIIRAQG